MSSIDHEYEQETADGPAEQITVDGSASSDTDTGGPLEIDALNKKGSDVPHHARSNSVKKPTTFKAVSVTKNFLAKAGTPAAPSAKTNGDNATNPAGAGGTMPPAPRPRLVAKTASASKASTPKSSHFGRHGGSGPDPMQVWNRNRAAPQPTPKHFTDEELKQQYGIHLATRLQADADGKESKWADIDDDEDDWAPETIEWNDGTKIDLSQNNQAAIIAEEQARALAEKERQEQERKAQLAAQQKSTTTVGPNATVLKPRSTAQPKTGGVVLKTSTEKPTLVAKPAAPAPVRSPWASLPPVEKVPPVEINPPSQNSTRPQANETQPKNAATAPPPPPAAMEIAADDFTRTRRDNLNGNLGQLYNARSGQYEPANAGRRESIRKDQNFRPPSLLQRGSQHEPQGPVDISNTSHTQRTGSQHDRLPWTRRGSSAVRGDVGSQGRRASTSKGSEIAQVPIEMLDQRRESQPLVSPSTPSIKDEHLSQSAVQSPAMQHAQLIQEGLSATESSHRSRQALADGTQALQRDDIAVQRALMKEKRELAIKRKKEEEEREEAAKKERIRIKMEKLGLPPLEEKKDKKESEKKQIEKRVVELPKPKEEEVKEIEELKKPTAHAEAEGSNNRSHQQELPKLPAQTLPTPPVPHAPDASQQHSIMKVHKAPSNNPTQGFKERPAFEQPKSQSPGPKVSPPNLEHRVEATAQRTSPMINGIKTSQQRPDAPAHKAVDHQVQGMDRDPRQQPWSTSQRDHVPYSGWSGQALPRDSSVSNSVWGPTSHSRALGNGTFDRSIQRPQSRPQDQFSSPALAPIGPPRHLQRPRETQDLRGNNVSPAPLIEDFQTIPTFPPPEAPGLSSTKPDLTSRSSDAGIQISPNQAGTEDKARPQINIIEQRSRDFDRNQGLKAWGSFGVAEEERERQLMQQRAARLAEDARNGIQRPVPQMPIMNETWRQVKVSDQGTHRQVIGVSKGQNTNDRPIAPQTNADTRSPSLMASTNMHNGPIAGMGRGSRFFPTGSANLQPQVQNALRLPPGYRRSTSPPPPEDELHYHPAYARDPLRPLVKLPSSKVDSITEDMTPKVRLPPTVTTPAQSPRLPEVRAIPLRAASQPLVNNPSWQDRFNGLLGVKKTTPEKKFAQVADGFSTTKVPLDLPSMKASASVSLPPHSDEPIIRALEPASKPVEDQEALFENREFGSLPAVTIPTKAPEVGWIDAKALKRGQSKQSKMSKEVDATSKEVLVEKDMVANGNILVFVRLLGMDLSKSFPMSRSNGQDANHGASRQRTFAGNAKPSKSYKPREGLANHNQNSRLTLTGAPNITPSGGSYALSRGQQGKARPAWGSRTATAVH